MKECPSTSLILNPGRKAHLFFENEEGKLRGEVPEHILEDIILRVPVPA
jgi:hypothetical protein